MPAPSTAGDFLRRFEEVDLVDLQEAINRARVTVWQRMKEKPRRLAVPRPGWDDRADRGGVQALPGCIIQLGEPP